MDGINFCSTERRSRVDLVQRRNEYIYLSSSSSNNLEFSTNWIFVDVRENIQRGRFAVCLIGSALSTRRFFWRRVWYFLGYGLGKGIFDAGICAPYRGRLGRSGNSRCKFSFVSKCFFTLRELNFSRGGTWPEFTVVVQRYVSGAEFFFTVTMMVLKSFEFGILGIDRKWFE